jgi:hypothetical protein
LGNQIVAGLGSPSPLRALTDEQQRGQSKDRPLRLLLV